MSAAAVAVGLILGCAVVVLSGPGPEARVRRAAGLLGSAATGPEVALGSAGRPRVRACLLSRRGASREPPLRDAEVALLMDLTAAAMRAGAPAVDALRIASCSLQPPHQEMVRAVTAALSLGAPWTSAWRGAPAAVRAVEGALGVAWHSGAPAAALLESGADELRRRSARRAAAAAERLGVRMVLPLGLCALPAFVLVGLVPVLLSLGRGVLGGG